jgi:hypothetical protein
MSDELLTQAARALRESHDGESQAATLTRTRVLLLAATRRKRRRLAAVVLLPIAAAFALSTAWAAATGRLPHWLSLLRGQDERAQVAAGSGHALPAPLAPPVASVASAPADAGPEDDAAPVEPVATAPPVPAPAVTAPRARTAPREAPSASSTAAGAASEEEQLFAAAQHQHFVARDPQAALKAWDAYLGAYPRGRLALEARYNRALTLVRLGRADEARAALQPFATGREGSYRQREASDLLRALDGGAP